MNPLYTILLPHKRNVGNNAALSICIDCLMINSYFPFALLMSAAYDQPLYETMNQLVEKAPTDTCIFMHSDMFVSPNWDIGMMNIYDPNTFVTGLLVEPGAIGVWPGNVEKDFGRRPENFRRTEFENWAISPKAPQASGEGWFAPYMFSRQHWLDLGGHDLDDPGGTLWTALDVKLFNKHKAQGGIVRQARAIVYHLQRWSEPSEQTKEGRS